MSAKKEKAEGNVLDSLTQLAWIRKFESAVRDVVGDIESSELSNTLDTLHGGKTGADARKAYLADKTYIWLKTIDQKRKYLPPIFSLIPGIAGVIVTGYKASSPNHGELIPTDNIVWWHTPNVDRKPEVDPKFPDQTPGGVYVYDMKANPAPADPFLEVGHVWWTDTSRDWGQEPLDVETNRRLARVTLAHTKRKSFSPVTFTGGRDYRYNRQKDLTEGIYARHYPSIGRDHLIDMVLTNLVSYQPTGREGHCTSTLELNAVDLANFGKSYPALKKAITNSSSGFYETLFELVLAIPALASSKIRKVLTYGTKAAKFAKAYVAWELAIHPTLSSIKDAINTHIEDFSTFRKKGFSVYTLGVNDNGSVDVQPILDPLVREWYLDLARSTPALQKRKLTNIPKHIRDKLDPIERPVVCSDYSITMHLGDVVKMSMDRQFVLKHGGHPFLLLYDLGPISFFADWFTHVWKTAFIDLDTAFMDYLYQGTYSNKLTLIERIQDSREYSGLQSTRKIEDIQISNVFYRKMFDPIAVSGSEFQEAYRSWRNSDWRLSLVLAMMKSKP